ncbi:hypothetical protein FHX37_3642 [Haloactinospora alba]|uniref:Uncharacterized protein n=1 Tax=Haloactinospora alba TaxID=405555 RepID=A0A543N921_9ACTN|nr:hypothetical protein [Haloactinospora alba]TQN28309.1 hypothetical protein FHX37_3642 [Haloactinospora alba]
MNEFLLVLTGAGVSLVSSVTVTWLQARHTRKTEARAAARGSTRQLTSLFITERDTPENGTSLTEAEVTSVAIADRRTRERVQTLVRLLRELDLPELRELSGTEPQRARRTLCDHALEVLGAHFRGERLPAVPQDVQRMLDVEDEALSIHAGGAPDSTAAASSGSATGTERAETSPTGGGEQRGGSGKGNRGSSGRKTAGKESGKKETAGADTGGQRDDAEPGDG